MYIIGILLQGKEGFVKESLEGFLSSRDIVYQIIEFHTIVDAQEYIKTNKKQLDFFFVEYQQEIIELCKAVKTKYMNCQIVFFTNNIEDVPKCYEVEHSYMVKRDRFDKWIEHMFQILKMENDPSDQRKIILKNRAEKLVVSMDDIIFVERYERRTHVFLKNKSREQIDTYIKMDSLYEKLDKDLFLRTHNSYIINIKYVETIYRDCLYLINGKEIPISRRYSKLCKEKFAEWGLI